MATDEDLRALWQAEAARKREHEAAREAFTAALRQAHAGGRSAETLAEVTGAPVATVGWRIHGPTAEARRKENPTHQRDVVKRGHGPGLSPTRAAEALGIKRQLLYSQMRSGKILVLRTASGATRIGIDELGQEITVPEGYLPATEEKWPKMRLYAAEIR